MIKRYNWKWNNLLVVKMTIGEKNYQSNLQINLQYQILKLVSEIAKNHAFEIMPKIMNHTKIGKIMKNHEIIPIGTPRHPVIYWRQCLSILFEHLNCWKMQTLVFIYDLYGPITCINIHQYQGASYVKVASNKYFH